ncbi:CRISPR-associated helicase Cas3' [Candidatus Pacearchaeota archaeon]|nr:MAG: CRISPR-associated helicase Cas3' [Candidatus Pacearchaeota archaeon]
MAHKWSNPEQKLSHTRKTLRQHIDEVNSLLETFLKFYGLWEKYHKIANFLAEYHDYGKLHREWELGKKRGHSHWSYEYLIEKKISLNEEVDPILQFLILRHHSTLSRRIGGNLANRKIQLNGKEFSLGAVFEIITEKELDYRIKSIPREELINLIDVFGLFKLADICSAEGKTALKFEKPKVYENLMRSLFQKLDEKRWKEQKTTISLPNIALLRAYTGWGKTTAGLLFFTEKSPEKIFYLMPTITAINKFYETLHKVFGDEKVSKYFYFLDTEIKENDEKLSQLFFFKNFITPYIITTVDQFLLSFLQTGKYYTKRVMFRNSGLIIDEIHLLNPLMLHLLTYFIKTYKKFYNLKILLMSATLPKALARYLKENIKIPDSSFLDFSYGYKEKRRIMWKWVDKDIENYLEKIIEKKRKGKRILVIVNTVEKAIKIGKKLEEEFGLEYGEDFIVFHARFMYLHRREKEEWIEKFKKNPHILIATQVCEVSLDISYDVLFTELASLSALIQRFGRVNRYGDKTKEINTYIFEPERKDKKRYPYSEEELCDARELVKQFDENKLENEKALLDTFDNIFTYEKLVSEIEDVKKKVRIENWEHSLKFFFSLEIDDERLRRLLDYREGFTVMVIPHQNCIVDETKEYVGNLLSKSFSGLSFNEKLKLFARIKEIAVPVPIWWIKGAVTKEEKGFPIIDFKDKIYNKKYGFCKLKSEII